MKHTNNARRGGDSISPPITKERISDILRSYQRRVLSEKEFPGFTRASVLMPIFPSPEGLSFLLTVRTDTVETHKGQISFPGGMQDTTDRDAIHTALRETEEETGIGNTDVEILGLLDDLPVPSRFIITPVVGFLTKRREYIHNPAEVAEIFGAPLTFFADEKNGRTELRQAFGREVTVWYFQYGQHLIWGATAAIIMNLIGITANHQ